jgi:hypothetical protein
VRIRSTTLFAVASCALGFTSQAQVLWDLDFDSSTDLASQITLISYSPPGAPPTVTYATVDTGDPGRQNALSVTVDSSSSTNGWHGEWEGILVGKSVATYDPEHTFIAFDLLVYELKPLTLRIDYDAAGFFNIRILDLIVNPTVAGSFHRIKLPLTAFTVSNLIGTPANNPTRFQFGIFGNPTNLDTWPMCATNLFLLDNIEYIVSPPLSIASSNNAVVLSWPTNAVGFTLQQNAWLGNGWTPVTNIPVVVNDQNQVLLAPVAAQNFYRLVGP